MTNHQKNLIKAIQSGKTLEEALASLNKDQAWLTRQNDEYESSVATLIETMKSVDTETETQSEDTETETQSEVTETETQLEDTETETQSEVIDNRPELEALIGSLWTGASHNFAREAKYCLNHKISSTTYLKAYAHRCQYSGHLAKPVSRIQELLTEVLTNG